MRPSIGRIVIYKAQEGTPDVPAMITAVNKDDTVELTVFEPGQLPKTASNVIFNNEKIDGWRPYTWDWPLRT